MFYFYIFETAMDMTCYDKDPLSLRKGKRINILTYKSWRAEVGDKVKQEVGEEGGS